MENRIQLSIIIVNYKVEKELIACISSIVKSEAKVNFEIIVVDNDPNSNIGSQLKEQFPPIKYIRSLKNVGFGAGSNLGVKYASGNYLFFLNPDTIIKKEAVDNLYDFMQDNPKAGMVAPLLFDPSGKVYPGQGSEEYNLINAIVTSSFINKLFPNNSISKRFFHKNWNKKNVEEFAVVPGTAFMISKKLFQKVGMFDEKLFLYFEEHDLAKRVNKLSYKNYIIPQAKIMHIWEASTKKRTDIDKIFAKSRYYFFKKNYGIVYALLVNVVSNFGKYEFMLGLILLFSIFLGLFKIRESMTFIGDQGWFYLSARDMIINGQIPLVGIASSHPWLHQGPFWTYLLALFFWLFNFDPVSGAYLTIILGVLSIVGIYLVGSTLFSKRAGLIASFLYTASPVIVYYMRLPYHTSPIPLFVIGLIFSLFKVIQNKLNYLPLSIFILAVLYNFEIATAALWGVLVIILIFNYLKSRENFKKIFNKKIVFSSFFSLMIPLSPMILYDVRNGFPQTLKFIAWIFYRAISLFDFSSQQAFSISKFFTMFNYLFNNFTKLIFLQSNLISLVILIFLSGWVIQLLFKRKKSHAHNLILLLIFIPLIFVVLNQNPSDAYLPMFFPVIILLFSISLDCVMNKKMFIPIVLILLFLVVGNINFMLKNNFMLDKTGKLFTLEKRLQVAQEILKISEGKDYNLIGEGPGSEFESFTMNYEYLTWWLGHGPSKDSENFRIYVSESAKGIKIESKDIDK